MAYKDKSQEELISIIFMRDIKIDELKAMSNHGAYISLCEQLIELKHALNECENNCDAYRQWFKDREWVTQARPLEEVKEEYKYKKNL